MQKKILIIDDDIDILDSLQILLENEGYSIRVTHTADDARQVAVSHKPDLILLDLLLSGKDGAMVCQDLKKHPLTKHIPVVIMSAHPNVKKRAEICDADEFLAKPFEINDLLNAINRHIFSEKG